MLRVLERRSDGPLWPAALMVMTAAAAIFVIFFWRLAGLVPGLSSSEAAARSQSASIHTIVHNPINAPHKLLQLGFSRLEPAHIFWLRLPSVLFALIFLFCFYKLAVSWFGRSIGLFASLIFAALPLYVVCARQVSPDIMYFSPVVLLWLYTWLLKPDSPKTWAWLGLMSSSAILLYTPGVLWWILAGFIIGRRRIVKAIGAVPPMASAAGLLALAAAAGSLAVSAAHNHSVARQLVLLPAHLPPITVVIKQCGWMLSALFLKTGSMSNLIIERLPILNVLLIALLIFGVYAMIGAARRKAAALILSILFGVAAAGLDNNLALLALGLPAAAVFIAAGLRYLYIEWRSIFPRNPVPKNFALVLIAAVTLSQFYFGLRYSLIAWPHSEPARSAYVLK